MSWGRFPPCSCQRVILPRTVDILSIPPSVDYINWDGNDPAWKESMTGSANAQFYAPGQATGGGTLSYGGEQAPMFPGGYVPNYHPSHAPPSGVRYDLALCPEWRGQVAAGLIAPDPEGQDSTPPLENGL